MGHGLLPEQIDAGIGIPTHAGRFLLCDNDVCSQKTEIAHLLKYQFAFLSKHSAMENRYPGKADPPTTVTFDGFALQLFRPGTHVLHVEETAAIIDIHLGEEDGKIAFSSKHPTPQTTSAQSFSFIPPAFLNGMKFVRPGASILLIFEPQRLRIPPARETISEIADPLWNRGDTGMIGAGVLARDYMETPNHTVRRPETIFLSDLLSIRLTQILRR